MTGGPLVARGKVMVGTTGRAEGGNYIAALDAETGKEAWRFYTIARPGEPGGNSWNGLPLEKRNGGSVWIPGSYDPVHNLAFFAPGNTYDTGPIRILGNQPGVTNDALYLDSTLALEPDTGRLEWYFQHQANGQWDLDWAFERQVMQLPVNGSTQTVVVTAGKQMIFDIVEAETGKYLSSIDLGLQNLVTSIDPKTGAKITDPNLLPGDGKTKMICPHVSGGRGWMPTSYDAATKILYLPIVEACMDLGARRGRRTWKLVERCPVDGSAASWKRRQVWASAGAQSRNKNHGLGRTAARAADDGDPRHGWRARVCRRARPNVSRVRRRHWRPALEGSPERRAELRADQLLRQRTGIRRCRRRSGRLSVEQLRRARAGNPESTGPRRGDLGV